MKIPTGSRNNDWNFVGYGTYVGLVQMALQQGESALTAFDTADEVAFLLQARILDDGPSMSGPDEVPFDPSYDSAAKAYAFNAERRLKAIKDARRALDEQVAKSATQPTPDIAQ